MDEECQCLSVIAPVEDLERFSRVWLRLFWDFAAEVGRSGGLLLFQEAGEGALVE